MEATPQKKTSAWTDEESHAFLMAVIEQLLAKETKISIDFKTITIPGRTTRALQERWLLIRKGVSASGIAGSGPAGTPQKRAPRKAKDADTETPTKKRKFELKTEAEAEAEQGSA